MSLFLRYIANKISVDGYYCIYDESVNKCLTELIQYVSTPKALQRVTASTSVNLSCPTLNAVIYDANKIKVVTVTTTCRIPPGPGPS